MSETSERVLLPLPDGRWLALAPDVFREALMAGSALVATTSASESANTAEQLLNAEKLATALSLPVTWIEQAARERRIPSIQAGRWRRFSRSAVERALCELQVDKRRK
jgi:excisionase family DNA binding protein